ncbi:Protein of unknown function [Bacillus thuringiensis]|uniref:Uncharacterized protein n=2 Tax=Bacillus cereus group TaxID=86661 RepID=A0A1C4G288_BACTU|nr:Protein of unknown function [Bacillus mycoides]SCC56949.1 Protein of unknown function [Bacillus mycoides]SCC62232.1 Protein of unknown function [Bacillus thuringiensis]SCM89094.1 Protein of unknown function [Bacillus mycoides]SCV24877.1 Protein of unknown function [Bacillus wiedmannii]
MSKIIYKGGSEEEK